ncbi:unnamed protein product [Periconia digitata]|uniref:Uncharacterized protein n=1 Tax=Periconia digitata TaxID=1303443 RepID=A0A9W4UEG7_9PLEO|nr:unnamed protein product [Periconia digitata]
MSEPLLAHSRLVSSQLSADQPSHGPSPHSDRIAMPSTKSHHQTVSSTATKPSDPHASSQETTLLASSDPATEADSGLPPTPPSNSHDTIPPAQFSPPPHVDGVVSSLLSNKPSTSTPVNQRSPPTPDPSPPRTNTSRSMPTSTPERPVLFGYPSSRAESFKTAREDPFTTEESSRSTTPFQTPWNGLGEDQGLGLAFERDDGDQEITPRNTIHEVASEDEASSSGSIIRDGRGALDVDQIPNREWNTELMRNVTVRKKRNPRPAFTTPPKQIQASSPPVSPTNASKSRRSTSLRERVEASRNSPHTPSIENFAKSIGWPAEGQADVLPESADADVDAEQKRMSTSSMSSAVVEAVVIVTPPQRQRSLRHSGRNLAYARNMSSPAELSSRTPSNRSSMQSDKIPLHKLVHKRADIYDRRSRTSIDSGSLSYRTESPLLVEKRRQESAASTLAHQRSVREVLQPAAEVVSRSNSIRSAYTGASHKRNSSAPEPVLRRETASPNLRGSREDILSPNNHSPRRHRKPPPSRLAHTQTASPTRVANPEVLSPVSPVDISPATKRLRELDDPFNINKSLPALPVVPSPRPARALDLSPGGSSVKKDRVEGDHNSPALAERVRLLLAEKQGGGLAVDQSQHIEEHRKTRTPSTDTVPTVRRGSASTRGRSEERRRSSTSQDRGSTSRDTLRPSLDRIPTEELPRTSHEWRSFHTDEHGRVSFDRSISRTEEHAMARHLFAQTTPFSQISDTPIEVSEATAVSIYPHNNNSLLVVQQFPRSSLQPPERPQLLEGIHFGSPRIEEDGPLTPPFVDAKETFNDPPPQPTLTFEPSTPPMQIELPNPIVVDSPLKNPRQPPEPPVIKFIPPTPAEELERQLPPGPPKRSDSHPQRRLSLKQRARRYSDNFITPFLSRANSMRGRRVSESHTRHPQVPSVNDDDNALHPFWRPRGFWDGFDDSDSESDDGYLPRGGDTSDVEDAEPEPASPRNIRAISRRLNSIRRGSSGGFLIGNSLGVERSGTNRRRPQITLPSTRLRPLPRLNHKPSAPKIMIQPPTQPLGSHAQRIQKYSSHSSLQSSASSSQQRRDRRDTWRKGKKIPGLKGYQVQYIGLSGVRERMRERKAERRREQLRRSIGGRWYVEPGSAALGAAPAPAVTASTSNERGASSGDVL